MSIPDEMLMAYVDGELEGEARAAIERALAGDARIAARIAHHRSLRERLRAAYDPVLAEPVPERLIEAAQRARGKPTSASATPLRGPRAFAAPRWSAREWTAIAASLVIGALVSALALRSFDAAPVESSGGRLIARGTLAAALTTELAGRPSAPASVTIGVTFRSKSGEYCRTFTFAGRSALAGLACRNHDAWQIEALARSAPAVSGSGGAYRPAASPLPRAILDAANAMISGEPLDARAEAAARARRWARP